MLLLKYTSFKPVKTTVFNFFAGGVCFSLCSKSNRYFAAKGFIIIINFFSISYIPAKFFITRACSKTPANKPGAGSRPNRERAPALTGSGLPP
jgi:hypothetical protein